MNLIDPIRGSPLRERGDSATPEDPRVVQALEEYAEAVEAGRPPPLPDFLARHDAIAGELARCLDGLEFLHVVARQLSPGDPIETGGELAAAAVIGGYRVIREIGRGGMGIVYEAEEASTGKQLALKVLPFAATFDSRHLQRFRNEAQAVAQLHHPNIVPVFDVRREDRVHFYAMRYIDGQTAAEWVRAQRVVHEARRAAAKRNRSDDTLAAAVSTEGDDLGIFRSVALLGIQAAEALDYAHHCGVIHRDIKPANLLLEKTGHVWVADFGLAHFDGCAELTQTGDVLGTLRYMSPEQALARRGLVDHRTDIYSLGATLYEMLTLEPVVDGSDRQELLRKIAVEEPRRPRRLNRAIPYDLETILIKTLAKSPDGRYATAADLADDLKRFVAGQPVRARRPGLVARARRWAGRHRGLVAAAAVIAVLGVAALVATTTVISRQRNEAELRRQEADLAVDDMYTQVAEKWLAREPGLERLQEEFLLKALGYCESRAARDAATPKLRLETARAYRRVGDIRQRLGEADLADTAFDRAIALLADLTAEFPALPVYLEELGKCQSHRGSLFRDAGRPAEAEKSYREAENSFATLLNISPEAAAYRDDVASNANNLGIVLMSLGRTADAEQLYRKAHTILEELVAQSPDEAGLQHNLASCCNNLGNTLAAAGRRDDANAAYAQASRLWEALSAKFPDAAVYRAALAVNDTSLGLLLSLTGQPSAAEGKYRKALAVQEHLAAEFPESPSHREQLALTLYSLGDFLAEKRHPAEAKKSALQERLAAEFPDAPSHREHLALTLYSLGDLLAHERHPAEAKKSHERALALREQLSAQHPDAPTYRNELAASHDRLAQFAQDSGRLRAAETGFRKAVELWSKLTTDFPGVPAYRRELAGSVKRLGKLLAATGRLTEGTTCLDRALALTSELATQLPAVPHRSELAACLHAHGCLLQELGQLERSKSDFQNALDIFEKLAADLPHAPAYSMGITDCLNHLGRLHEGSGRRLEAERLYRRGITVAANFTAVSPSTGDCRNVLAVSYWRLGALQTGTGKEMEATDNFRAALELWRALTADYPAVLRYRQNLAWALATCPERRLRDQKSALGLATKIVQETSEDARSWTILAMAQYRAGAWPAAREALEKARRLRGFNTRLEHILLAMTCCQAGDPVEGRHWLQRTRPEKDEFEPELKRLRAEADALLMRNK